MFSTQFKGNGPSKVHTILKPYSRSESRPVTEQRTQDPAQMRTRRSASECRIAKPHHKYISLCIPAVNNKISHLPTKHNVDRPSRVYFWHK